MKESKTDYFGIMQHIYSNKPWRDWIPILGSCMPVGWNYQSTVEVWFLSFSHEFRDADAYELGIACDLSLCTFIHDNEFVSLLHEVSLKYLADCVRRSVVSKATAECYRTNMKAMQNKLTHLALH